jgi:hypothetical protein
VKVNIKADVIVALGLAWWAAVDALGWVRGTGAFAVVYLVAKPTIAEVR